MTAVSHAELDLYRRRWVRVLIDTYALGMYTVMVGMTLYNVSRRIIELPNRRLILGYTITMSFITAGWYYAATRVDEALIVESLAGPQVSSELGLTVECTPTRVISDTLSLLQFWGNDALMLYRAYTMFEGNILVLALPTMIFFAFIALGIVITVSCWVPGIPQNLGNALYSLSAALNILVTSMIVMKLWLHRHRSRKHGINISHGYTGDVYITAIGVLAESATLYTIATLTYVVLNAYENPARTWWQGVMMSMSYLSQALIILRITMGYSYTRRIIPRTQKGKLGGLVFAHSTQRSNISELSTLNKLDQTVENETVIADAPSADKAGSMM